MMKQANVASDKQAPLWTIGISFLFLYAFASCGYFIYRAVESDNGMITEKPYDDALKFEDRLERLRNTRDEGWVLHIDSSSRDINISIRNSEEISLEESSPTYRAIFPAAEVFDRSGTLQRTSSEEVFKLPAPLPKNGIWLIEVSVPYENTTLLFEDRIFIR